VDPEASDPDANDPPPSWRKVVTDAAVEAEFQTGVRERTVAEARRHVAWRIVRTVVGFSLVAMGILALPLPGPGWLIVIAGLSLLPFRWAERTVVAIRRRIPGVPENGRIPVRTWLVMGAIIAVATASGIAWGDDLRVWLSRQWGEPSQLLG
jgi:hypothetical protein